jgi:hypothetical protein
LQKLDLKLAITMNTFPQPQKLTSTVVVCLLLLLFNSIAQAQRCVIRVEPINQNRYAYQTAEECDGGFHSVPWGNWGVNSNVGKRLDTNQFQGWHQPCTQTKVEWNSCSSRSDFRSALYLNFPNYASYYSYPTNWYPLTDSYTWNDRVPPFGAAYNVDQYSPCGWNGYGDVTLTYTVTLRTDSNGDGIFDKGGCADLNGKTVTLQGNFMSVYELDSPDSDDLIQTMLYPDLSAVLRCTPNACFQTGDRNLDGWHDDVTDFWSPDYQWPTLYENPQRLQSRADERRVPAKRIDATIRLGRVLGTFTN